MARDTSVMVLGLTGKSKHKNFSANQKHTLIDIAGSLQRLAGNEKRQSTHSGVRVLSITDRKPTPGFEKVSLSRAGVYGIGPGADHVPKGVAVVVCLVCDLKSDASPVQVGALAYVPLRSCNFDAWTQVKLAPHDARRAAGIADGALCVSVKQAILADAKRDFEIIAQPSCAVIDTGSTMGYVSSEAYSQVRRWFEQHPTGRLVIEFEIASADESSKHEQDWSWNEAMFTASFRSLPTALSKHLSQCVWILGARALQGRMFALDPHGLRAWT